MNKLEYLAQKEEELRKLNEQIEIKNRNLNNHKFTTEEVEEEKTHEQTTPTHFESQHNEESKVNQDDDELKDEFDQYDDQQ